MLVAKVMGGCRLKSPTEAKLVVFRLCCPYLRVQDRGVSNSDVSLHHIGAKQSKGHQGSRPDGEALADGSSGVASCVQGISALTDVLSHGCHFSNATGVVRDGAVGINCETCMPQTGCKQYVTVEDRKTADGLA